MNIVVLDTLQMNSKVSAHAYLKEMLAFPEYYGGNLDALYDCLTDICEDTIIEVKIYDERDKDGDGYLKKMIAVLREAEKTNGNLKICIV